jgi:hypothetical protein
VWRNYLICFQAWSGKHHASRPLGQSAEAEDATTNALPQVTDSKTKAIYRENLVVLDNENHLYHVVVKGMHVRDGKEVNTQVGLVAHRSSNRPVCSVVDERANQRYGVEG